MNWIEKMIAEQCPNGVKKVKLGDVCEIYAGGDVPAGCLKGQSEPNCERPYPVFSNGKGSDALYGYASSYRVETAAVTIAARGSIGYHAVRAPFFTPIVRLITVETRNNINIKYIDYILSTVGITGTQGGIPQLTVPMVKKIEIPLPSLSIQEEIVSVLDKFSELIEKTDEEIALRQKQYEYYREKLLTFEDGEVEWKPLASVFDTRNGYTPSTNNKEFWDNGDIPWFKMEDIRDNGRILSDSKLHITSKAVKGKGLFKANTIILATSATIGEHALVTVDYLSNQRFTNLSVKKEFAEKVDIKFYYFYMYLIDNWCKEHINQGGFASVDMGALYKLLIPIPSLSRQQKIVDTLDKFEALISKLKEERELRQKQYEYYREKLLTF